MRPTRLWLWLNGKQLVESVIGDLLQDHRADFHVVRLNGFIHTDDKLALREIWRQLGREMDVDDGSTGKVPTHDTGWMETVLVDVSA